MNEYDLIVSIGDWCGPAHNIRRFFGVEESYPFDWWITPYEATIKLLNSNFEGMLNPANLVIEDNSTVRCTTYGLLHHHDFERDDNDLIKPDIDQQINHVYAKTYRRIQRLLDNTKDKEVLFVRSNLWNEGVCAEGEELRARVDVFYDALLMRYSHCRRLDLLVLAPLEPEIISRPTGRVIVRPLGERIGSAFFWDDNYDAVFNSLGIKLKH
ncbi:MULTISPECIES: DUF1796 family putative cysteine peptidase [unclassified Acidocella]|uniref:DUF1796 family putative cysteine peptidase n=1 Tax=unclassified Acidocella TaxID=2648610 RepID=UPI0009FDA924|nr:MULTISPECIES: DUF1796 family putative cysteine peptidase [unclassified Acidocella]WBO60420.1 papain-like cysteine peptidase [Acidocella sp. MX-AZ03]